MSYRRQKYRIVGPLEVVAVLGKFGVVDRGNGSIFLSPELKTRKAAERWAQRHAPIADHAVKKQKERRGE